MYKPIAEQPYQLEARMTFKPSHVIANLDRPANGDSLTGAID